MPYTRGWNDGTPAGARAANQIDDAIREFKVDLHERMDSTFAVDWTADPVVAKDTILGKSTARIMIFGPHGFHAVNDEDNVRWEKEAIRMNETGLTINGTIYLPHGLTITKFEAAMDRGAAANCVAKLHRVAYATGVASAAIDTATRAIAGVGITAGAGGVLAEVVDSSTNFYMVEFTAAGWVITGPRLFAVRLTVDVPGSQSAV